MTIKTVHVVSTLFVLLAAALGGAAGSPEAAGYAPLLTGLAAMALAISHVIALAAQSVMSPQPSPTPAARGFILREPLFLLSFLGVVLVGCAWLAGSGPVTAATLGDCIIKDAVEGKPVGAIALDCSTDVATVLSTVLASTQANVVASKTRKEAVAAQLSMRGPGGE